MSVKVTVPPITGPCTFSVRGDVNIQRNQNVNQTHLRPLFRLYGEIEGILQLLSHLPITGTISAGNSTPPVVAGEITLYNRDDAVLVNLLLQDLIIALQQVDDIYKRGKSGKLIATVTCTCKFDLIPARSKMS